jgi:hypothetical protein
MQKPEARILDATAGNRTLWRKKESPLIFWIDIESELDIKPDQVIDCTKTDFPDNYFYAIFFDPPHGWGGEVGKGIYTCRNEKEYTEYKEKYNLNRWGNKAVYYGWDKYKTKTSLLGFIYKAQKEFLRILGPGGMLWFKWNESKIPLYKILPLFKEWVEMLRFHVASPLQRIGTSQTYWIMFMKKTQSLCQRRINDNITTLLPYSS